ncbi:hypothetical protein RDABS01_012947 [Bienertia sinuspersici]
MSVSLHFITSTSTTTTTSSSVTSSNFIIGVLRHPSLIPPKFTGTLFRIQCHLHRGYVSNYENGVERPISCRSDRNKNHGQTQFQPNFKQKTQFFPSSLHNCGLIREDFRRNMVAYDGSIDKGLEEDDGDPFEDADDIVINVEEEDDGFNFPDVERWDVLGLGQAMVDFSGVVDEEFLERLGLEKGTRRLVNHEERGKVLGAMDGCSYKAAAGGSLSNSLVALARLGSLPLGGPVLNVAMAGSVGSDPLGGFYRAKLRRAGVNFFSTPVKDGTTGTVIVLTTPDAQRTMLAYQGTSSKVNYDSGLSDIVCKTNILVVEGYLFELPDTIKAITKACKDAHSSGALVAVTASDVSCIERHYDDFWEIIGNYADIIFANSDEARALCNFSLKESPISATRYLSHFVPLVSVTDGVRGSYIGVKGEAIYIPPSPCVPVDTCGAGDAYASGILYGIVRGVSDLNDMGTLAARIAAVVVGQQGTRLRVQDAVELAESYTFHLENSGI